MAHYAFLDENNIVVKIIVGRDESNFDWERFYGDQVGMVCKRTSYNTHGGEHPNGEAFRKNFAGIGYSYDAERDAFIPPKPYESWVLNEETCLWEPPVAHPNIELPHYWDEVSQKWVLINE